MKIITQHYKTIHHQNIIPIIEAIYIIYMWNFLKQFISQYLGKQI